MKTIIILLISASILFLGGLIVGKLSVKLYIEDKITDRTKIMSCWNTGTIKHYIRIFESGKEQDNYNIVYCK